ncbi:MAG: hypothetical protein V4615_08930 [Bacteroidota bacterium]
MKQSKQVFFLMTLILLLMSSGCKDKSALLAKTWMVNDLQYTTEVPKEMQPTIDKSVAEMRNSFRLTYNPDGTYKTQMNDQLLEGKWKMNWNSTIITSTTDKGATKDFKVLELTESSFKFEADEGGEKVIFVMIPAK